MTPVEKAGIRSRSSGGVRLLEFLTADWKTELVSLEKNAH